MNTSVLAPCRSWPALIRIQGMSLPRGRSVAFIGLLQRLDDTYPPEAVIRVVLDNHAAHISKETMAYLGTRPGRFA